MLYVVIYIYGLIHDCYSLDMNKTYLVKKPVDFKEVITDILCLENISTLVISLKGDLGSGKTTFTQQLGEMFGVTEQINSPTFTIMKQYLLESDKYDKLVHIDAYRIESEDEIEPLHLESVVTQPKTIVCIEWPEQIKSIVPDGAIEVVISITEDEMRQVEVSQI